MSSRDTTDVPRREGVRRAMRVSSDPRAARTRAAILAAVHQLVADGNSTPSVSEIARQAGISRSSFYTQFADLDALISAIFAEAVEAITVSDAELRRVGSTSEPEATRIAVERLIGHVAEHRNFYRLGLSTTIAAYHEAIALVASQFSEAACMSAPPAGVNVEAAATYLAGGMIALLHTWISGDFVASPEQVTSQIMLLLPGWLVSPADTDATASATTHHEESDSR